MGQLELKLRQLHYVVVIWINVSLSFSPPIRSPHHRTLESGVQAKGNTIFFHNKAIVQTPKIFNWNPNFSSMMLGGLTICGKVVAINQRHLEISLYSHLSLSKIHNQIKRWGCILMCEFVISPWWSFSSIQFKMKPFICYSASLWRRKKMLGTPFWSFYRPQ